MSTQKPEYISVNTKQINKTITVNHIVEKQKTVDFYVNYLENLEEFDECDDEILELLNKK